METHLTTATAAKRALAEKVDCLIPEDLRLLSGEITENTEEAWNKRGTGPPSIMFGKQRLYPLQPLKGWLLDRIRERTAGAARSAL